MTRFIDRRAFLTLLAMAAAEAAAQPITRASGKRVVVLGGGLSGLAAAWNLMKHGYDVRVFEAQDIPGGRVKTIRAPFRNGGYAEAGAVRIPNNHRYTMKYIRLMGLEPKLVAYEEDGKHLWYLQGRRFTTPEKEWPLAGLNRDEKINPFAMLGRYWRPGFQAVGDPTRPEFPTASALTLDPFRLAEFFRRNGASDAWLKVFFATEGCIGRVNTLAVTALEGAPNDGDHTHTYGLLGGNDQLPKALARALGKRVTYRSPVVRLAHRKDDVTVTVRNPSGLHEMRADHCICTLPFPVLRQVQITPAFSEPKMQAIEGYGLASISRVYFQTRTQFWRNDPLGTLGGLNMVGTDTPVERIWNTSQLQPDPGMGMLQSYMFDENALAFARIPPKERVSAWTKRIARFLPDLPDEVVASYTKAWHEDPWAKGAFAFVKPNEFGRMWPAARRVEGRVHFAGEHTSPWGAYQNGALESAERCVQEVLQAEVNAGSGRP
jgi:monoamine oxidase